MKFALLGADVESLELAAAALSAGHELRWQGDLGAAGDAPPSWLSGADEADSWEDLLNGDIADAVIVGQGLADEELRGRQVQELVRFGLPVLAVFPVVPSVLTYFEIDMARTESGAVLRHYNPLVMWEELGRFAEWVAGGHPELGRIEQVVATRSLVERDRPTVLWHFARDVELLDRVAGRLNRIGAHAGAAGDEASYSGLSVQLLGPGDVPVRWNVEPPGGAGEGLTISLVFERGRVTAEFDPAGEAIDPATKLHESGGEAIVLDQLPAARAVDAFVAAVERGGDSTWPEALHAMELADSIEISLRRGRMIDIHEQQLTEHLAFKGTMAALGCGVLVVLVPVMLVGGWIAGVFGIPVAQFWPHALLAMLVIFLGLQLLPKLLYGAPPPKSEE